MHRADWRDVTSSDLNLRKNINKNENLSHEPYKRSNNTKKYIPGVYKDLIKIN